MINTDAALLIVVDMQGNLFQAMYQKEKLLANALKMIKGAKILNIPILVTEQIPEKMGKTISSIAQELVDCKPVSKESFSCWRNDQFREKLAELNRREVIILGIESHVCVYQTVIDLVSNDYFVHVATDAVSSRTKENSNCGLDAIKNTGAHLTSAEMVLFELIRTAGHAKFKEILKIVK